MTPNIESIGVAYEEKFRRKLLIINCYRPPKGNIQEFLLYLDTVGSSPEFSTHEVWVLGDLNINIKTCTSTKAQLFSHFKVMGLKSHHNQTTHPSRTGGSCLDLIISNSSNIIKCGTISSLISDHYPIYAVRGITRAKASYKTVTARSYQNYDKNELLNHMCSYNWTAFDSLNNVNPKWDEYIAALVSYLDIHCPVKTKKVRGNSKPWITPKITSLINERNNMVHTYNRKLNGTKLADITTMRKNINTTIKQSKRKFMEEKLAHCQNNPKKFWRAINDTLKPRTTEHDNWEFIEESTG
jgi:hypothetical protein